MLLEQVKRFGFGSGGASLEAFTGEKRGEGGRISPLPLAKKAS